MNITDVLWVISDRDDLVNGSSHGIYPFSEYHKHNDRAALYYDDKDPTYEDDGTIRYPVVLDCIVDEYHHDIISTYGRVDEDYTVTVYAEKFQGRVEVCMVVEANEDSIFKRNAIIYCISNGQYYVC
jgi:hypothetical protein